MSPSRRRGEARLLLGVPVLLAGALVGLCLSGEAPTVAGRARSPREAGRLAPALTRGPGRTEVEPGPPRAPAGGAPGAAATDGGGHEASAGQDPALDASGAAGDACCGAGQHAEEEAPATTSRGVLLGRVLDPGGIPLAAARVEARSLDGALRAVGQSDADGGFRLDAPAGALVVVARCAGWLDGRSLPVALRAGDAAHVGDVRLALGATLAGRVVDAAGRPVEGARVQVDGERHVVSEADGVFEVTGLPAGETTLVASAAGGLPSEPLRCVVTGPAAGAVRGVELRLRGAPRLRGRVLGPDGRPVAGARVARLGDLDAAIATGADGAFELAGERAGEPLLVTAPGLAAARVDATQPLEVRLAAVLPAPGTTPRLALRRDGAPVPGVALLVAPAGAGDLDGAEARVEVVTSDAAGVVWLAPGAFDLALVDAATAHARLETRSLSADEPSASWELSARTR